MPVGGGHPPHQFNLCRLENGTDGLLEIRLYGSKEPMSFAKLSPNASVARGLKSGEGCFSAYLKLMIDLQPHHPVFAGPVPQIVCVKGQLSELKPVSKSIIVTDDNQDVVYERPRVQDVADGIKREEVILNLGVIVMVCRDFEAPEIE